MQIFHVAFEEPLSIKMNDKIVKLVAFKTPEPGNIKFGVDADRTINVHREEIYHAIKLKEMLNSEEN